MSGVYTEEKLHCVKCKRLTIHHTEWSSEEPLTVIAQCEHYGHRMVTCVNPTFKRIGKMNYFFINN